jgi:hypothetical protein
VYYYFQFSYRFTLIPKFLNPAQHVQRLGCKLDDQGMGFNSLQGKGFFSFPAASTSTLEPSQPPTQWLVKNFSQGTKQQGVKLTSPATISVETKTQWSYTSTPLYAFIVWCLTKRRHNFNLFSLYHLTKFQTLH